MLTLRQGLYKSKNMVSIRILQAIGPQYGQDYLTRFGFDKARQPAVLLALGAGSVTPLQVAGAYAVFANGGYRITPYLIDRVTDSNGKVIMQSKPVVAGDAAARAIDPRTAWIMDDILRGVATYGTAARARVLLKRNDIAGKTGTTNESVDAWFSGYTPSLVATSWLGFDQPKSLGSRETGGGVAMPIWVDYMQTALKGVPEEKPRPARTASSSRTANTISRNSRRDRRWPAWACRKPTRWASSSTAWAAAARTTASRWRRASAPGQRPWSQKIPF